MTSISELHCKSSEELYDLLLTTDDEDYKIKPILLKRRVTERVKFEPIMVNCGGAGGGAGGGLTSGGGSGGGAGGDLRNVSHVVPANHGGSSGSSISSLANDMIASGWKGEGMKNPRDAMEWVQLAADDPSYRIELGEAERFWQAAGSKYKKWLAGKKFRGEI